MATIAALKTSIANLLAQINALAARKPDKATTADNATTLSGVNRATLLSDAQTRANTHIARTDNPHAINAAKLGGVDKAYINTGIATSVPLNALAVSQFGDTDTSSLGVTSSGWTLKFTKVIQAYVQGVFKLLPIQDIVLTTIDAAPANKTFYVYVSVVAGDLAYRVTLSLLPESLGTMYIGKVVTNGTAITSHTVTDRITRIGIDRVAVSAQGCSIPTTAGSPIAADKLSAAWHP
jgi:hypothetical protein